MDTKKPALAAKSPVKLADGERLEKVQSNLTTLSAADTVCISGGPQGYTLPGAPRAPFVRLYEGDAFSWRSVPNEVIREALDAYEEALRDPPLKLRRCTRRVLAVGAAVPGGLKCLASGQWARRGIRSIPLLPPEYEEIRLQVGRYGTRVQLAEYGRMTRVLLAHATEVQRVMGDEVVEMGLVTEGMYERAQHEYYDGGYVDPGTARIGSEKAVANVPLSSTYMLPIPDCQACGLYECRRCGKSRQLRLIELYEEWKEPVIKVAIRAEARLVKEEQRLCHAKRVEIAKAGYKSPF